MPAKPDISLIIAELLSENDEVVVDGIGTFFTKKSKEDVELDANFINLPSRALSFRDSFQNNDNRLADAICKTYDLDKEAAHQAIESFATGIQRDLLLSKDCDLPGLGVLNFKQPDQIELGISYLDLDDSFFGISKLNYQPIVREKNSSEEDLSTKKEPQFAVEQVVEKENKHKSWSIKDALLNKVAYLVIFLISFGWFILANQGQNTVEQKQDFKPVPTRINVAPEKEPPIEKKIEAPISNSESQQEISEINDGSFENIMLYAFSDPNNIEKAKIRIEALGYEPIVSKTHALQTIHIRVGYISQEDLEATLKEIKGKITHRAYIISE